MKNVTVDLWWPFGHGQQPLKDLVIDINMENGETFHAEKLVKRPFVCLFSPFLPTFFHSLFGFWIQVGFRTVELVQEPIPASPGLSFYFRINGQPIFLKGSNWIPAHAFQDQITAVK